MEDEAALAEALVALTALAPSGFAIALHVRFTSARWLFQSYPKDWIAHYSREGYVLSDPTVLWGFENTGTIPWAELGALDPRGIIAEAERWGLRNGLTHVLEEEDSRSIGSFTRPDRAFTPAEQAEIAALMRRAHRLTAALPGLTARPAARLEAAGVRFTHP